MNRILIVDDEEDVLTLARVILEAEGYDVCTAADGEEAQSMILDKKPDLVLLDVVLPGISGLELCRQMRRDKATESIKIILFTALGTEVTLMLDRGDKADDYILKPFTSKTLTEKIKKHLLT